MNKYGVANWLKFQYANGWIKNTETDMNRKVEILKFVWKLLLSFKFKTSGGSLPMLFVDEKIADKNVITVKSDDHELTL